MKDLFRSIVRHEINEQNSRRTIIDTPSKTYILVYDNSYLLNNILTRIRVMEGVSTVYQRDAIKKVGNRSKVPVEISYLPVEGSGGDAVFVENMLKNVRNLKGVVRLENPVAAPQN
jgi:protein gp37